MVADIVATLNPLNAFNLRIHVKLYRMYSGSAELIPLCTASNNSNNLKHETMDSATSDDRSLQDLPLPALFQRGRALLKQLQAVSAGPGTQQLVQQAGACWTAAAAAADALALFSANEDLEDLATADIKYLLIPFYQAEVMSHTHGGVAVAQHIAASAHMHAAQCLTPEHLRTPICSQS
jgi:hypothetical protein